MTDCPTLEEYKKRIDERFQALEKLAERERDLLHAALMQAKEAIDYRLEGMNDLRRQIELERGRFTERVSYDLHCANDDEKHDKIHNDITLLASRLYALEGKLWAGGVALTVAFGLIQLVIHWFK